MTPHLIALNDACRLTSLSRTAILRLSDVGDFPERIPLHGRRFGFVRTEVEAWIKDRIQRVRTDVRFAPDAAGQHAIA